MTIRDTTQSSLGPVAPSGLVADLADTLDAMVDQPLAGVALFGEDPPAVGRYIIDRRLGAGATAVVYAARDTVLDRAVALKIVARRDADGAWRDRVLHEARALASLSHPNVVAVHDVGEWRGHPFIAMEIVVGVTLARWQAQAPRAWPAILRHYLAAGRGLAAAHSAELVHRDFKPANVLVADSGRVVVTDFGLATFAEHAASRAAAIMGGGIGTPAYLAPEQREGAPPQPSADVYSFSVALCEALVGAHPLLAPAFDWQRALGQRGLPGPARAAIERGMAADPAQRWPRMGPLLEALEAALPAPVSRRRRAAGVALALAAALAAGITGLISRRGSLAGALEDVPPGGRDASTLVSIARGLVADHPTVAAALLREIPASQRQEDWSAVARGALMRPIARELRCLGDRPRATPSVAHGLVAAIDASGHAIVCDLAAEQVVPLTDDAVCARVLDGDHVGVLTADDDFAIFARSTGWRLHRRIPLGPATPNPPPDGARCERDVSLVGLRAVALHRGDAWQLVDLAAPATADLTWAGDATRTLVAISRDRRRAIVQDARRNLSVTPSAETVVAGAWSVAHDPISGVAVATSADLAVTAIDVERGTAIRRADLPTLYPGSQVAPTGRMAVGPLTGGLVWWPLAGDSRKSWIESLGERGIVQLAFNRAGTRLAWRDRNGGIGVRDVGRASGDELSRGRAMCHVTFATDDRVGGVSCEGRVLAWDLAEVRAPLIGRHDLGHCSIDCGSWKTALWSASVHPSGSIVATAGRDGTVGLWPLGQDSLEATRLPIGPGRRSFSVAFSGDLLLVANRDPVAQIWNWRTRKHLADLPGHEVWAYSVAVAHPAPGSTAFVTGSRHGWVRFWSERGTPLGAVYVGGPVFDLVTSPRGRLVAVGAGRGDVAVYDIARSALVVRVKAHAGGTRRVAFLDEMTVISAGDDGVVQRIALPSGKITASIDAHHGQSIYDMDRHGDSLLTASQDGTVRLWDLRDRSLVRTYVGHKQHVTVVRWHPDGKRFVSGGGDTLNNGSGDAEACIWQVDRKTCQDWLIGHHDDIRAAQFIDDTRVMTASFDGTVRVWTPLPPTTAEALATELERRDPACLDEQQRGAYLGEATREAAERARACRREAP